MVPGSAGDLMKNTKKNTHTNIQIHKYTNTKIHKYKKTKRKVGVG